MRKEDDSFPKTGELAVGTTKMHPSRRGVALKRALRAVAVIAVLGIVAAACGGGNGDDPGDPTDEPTNLAGGTLRMAQLADVGAAFDPQKEYYSVTFEY